MQISPRSCRDSENKRGDDAAGMEIDESGGEAGCRSVFFEEPLSGLNVPEFTCMGYEFSENDQ